MEPRRLATAALALCAAVLGGCASGPQPTVTVTREVTVAERPSVSPPPSSSSTDNRGRVDGLHRCAADWNRFASLTQLRDLSVAALVDPIRRNRKSTAWVDAWSFRDGDVALIGPGKRGESVRAKAGQCLVATGPDIGKVFLEFGRTWEEISGDSPTEAAYPAVMMAGAGGNAWIRRDGTVSPIL